MNTSRLLSFVQPFCDSGKQLRIRPTGETRCTMSGIRQFREFEFIVEEDEGEFFVIRTRRRREQRERLSELLSSARFADTSGLARSINSVLTDRIGEPDSVVAPFVEFVTEGRDLDETDRGPRPAVELLSTLLFPERKRSTRIVYLQASAGAGKSWLLMRLAQRLAREQQERRRGSLALYIDAQGINLRSIRQQIAHQLDTYNGVLRFAEVAPLIRLGVLTLVVDGFDELITPSGQNDTLRALVSYLSDLQGEGSLLVSARTSFFYAYNLERARIAADYPFEIDALRLCPWGNQERQTFCELRGAVGVHDHLESMAAASEAQADLLSRPFIVAEAVSLLKAGVEIPEQQLVASVEGAFSERERLEKLQDPDNDNAPLLSRDQFNRLLTELALEMWQLRQTNLDAGSAEVVVDALTEEWGLDLQHRETLRFRIRTHAFLEPCQVGLKTLHLQFPHEVLLYRILVRFILQRIGEQANADVQSILRIAELPVTASEQVYDLLAANDRDHSTPSSAQTLGAIQELGATIAIGDKYMENVRANLGTVAVAALSTPPANAARVSYRFTNLLFSSSHTPASFERATLQGVTFERCNLTNIDARGADWSSVEFVRCDPIWKLVAEDEQEFPPSLPNVEWLVLVSGDAAPLEAFGASETRRLLFREADETAEVAPSPPAGIEILSRLARLANRVFWFTDNHQDTDDPGEKRLKSETRWRPLLEALQRHGFLSEARRDRRGGQAMMLHLKQSQEILRAIKTKTPPPDIAALLSDVRLL